MSFCTGSTNSMGTRVIYSRVASVIGRQFSIDVLATVLDGEGDMARTLVRLADQDILHSAEPDIGPVFAFKHVLIQEAIYRTLLETDRKAIHELVGLAIERLHAGRLLEHAEVLADHFVRSDRKDKAIRYLAVTGEKNVRLYSVEQADDQFRGAGAC